MGPQLFYIDINDKLGDDVSDDDVDIDDECNCAPLQHVSVTGLVRDTVAQVTLVQSFVNPLKNATIEAAYHFPLYEGVAVCGFEAEVDGRKFLGRVQERSAARKEFEGAVKAGKMASLMEQETPDVFQTSLGNVPPGKEIIVRITLVSEVKNDADENRIRFVLPTAIAPRYGEFPGPHRIPQAIVIDHSKMFPNVPDVLLDVAGSSLSTKFSVDLSFAMSQPISSVQSPSHTIEVHLGVTKTGEEAQYDPSCARVTLAADSFMDRDFVVVVNSPGVEEPKVLVERHPEHGTHAMALTFSPRFGLSPIGSSELVFLVDRSGSMEGETIEQAGQALQLFLNSIPSENLHYINIIGFGDTHQALFPRSVEYDASSLKQAMEYARSLRADMGGTEIASAFQEVLDRRRKDIPTQIFALTDGEVWDVDSIVDTIRAAVEEGEKSGAFVRVFSLGVGDAVSHHTIEAIARAGDGYGQVVVEGERMEKKVVQLLKASLTPPITDLCVHWTDDNHSNDARLNQLEDAEFEFIEPDSWCGSDSDENESTTSTKAPINLFGTLAPEEEEEAGTKAPRLPEIVTEILQTPFRIPPPYRGARLTISAILSSSFPVPEHIVLRGTSRDGPVELRVKVGPVVQHGEKLLHTLIARSLLRDLKEGSSYLSALIRKPPHDSKDGQMLKRLGIRLVKVADSSNQLIHPVSTAELMKRETINIGLKHCLSSKYTSWIAIDECNRQLINFKPTRVQLVPNSYDFCNFAMSDSPPFNCHASNTEEDSDAHFRFMSAVTSKFALEDKVDDFEYFGCANPYENEALQEAWTTCDVTAGSGGVPMLRGAKIFFPASAREEDEVDANSVSARATAASSGGESPKSSIHFKLFGHHHDATYNKSLTPAVELLSLDPHLRLLAILQHQSFDGSFQLASELGDLFHASVEEMEIALSDLRTKLVDHEGPHDTSKISDDDWRLVWATCLAVLYMQRDLAQLQEEWELVVDKAEKKVELLLQQDKDVVATAKQAALQFTEVHTRS